MHYTDDLIILDLTFTPTSLIEDGVDIALHGGELSDSNLIDKKLIETPSRTSARGLTEDELPTVGLRCPPLLACSLTRHLPTRIMTCS